MADKVDPRPACTQTHTQEGEAPRMTGEPHLLGYIVGDSIVGLTSSGY